MMTIGYIEGDGIGPEIMKAVQTVFCHLPLEISWVPLLVGEKALESHNTYLPNETLDHIRLLDATLKGPLETQVAKGHKSINVSLRQTLGLFANIRPVKSIAGISRYNNVDLVIFRENTEDLYAGVEKVISDDEVHAIKIITRQASTRIAKAAFEYALSHNRSSVTAVHKANIMKKSDGLFLEATRSVAKSFPSIAYREVIVDNMCMQLVMAPEQFDVIVTENLYGDILSDLAAGLVGGLGLVPSANLSKEVGIFEAVHGTAPDIVGKDKANPIALLLSSAMMLDYLKAHKEADRLRQSVDQVLKEGNLSVLTPDLGGQGSTTSLTLALCAQLDKER